VEAGGAATTGAAAALEEAAALTGLAAAGAAAEVEAGAATGAGEEEVGADLAMVVCYTHIYNVFLSQFRAFIFWFLIYFKIIIGFVYFRIFIL